MKYSGIVSDYFLINDFVSKNVEISSRSIFLNVLKGGVDYLLDQYETMKDELEKEHSPNYLGEARVESGSRKAEKNSEDSRILDFTQDD